MGFPAASTGCRFVPLKLTDVLQSDEGAGEMEAVEVVEEVLLAALPGWVAVIVVVAVHDRSSAFALVAIALAFVLAWSAL